MAFQYRAHCHSSAKDSLWRRIVLADVNKKGITVESEEEVFTKSTSSCPSQSCITRYGPLQLTAASLDVITYARLAMHGRFTRFSPIMYDGPFPCIMYHTPDQSFGTMARLGDFSVAKARFGYPWHIGLLLGSTPGLDE